MTTLNKDLELYLRVCDKVASYFSKSLKNWQFARQMTANRIVAEQLIHLGHHHNNKKEYNQILSKMNDRTVEEYYSKY